MDRKRNIGKFLEIFFIRSLSTRSARLSEFDAGNMILFQIKVLGRNIKETTVARNFIKVNARPTFTWLRTIRRINRISLNMKIGNMLQRFSCICFLFKPPWFDSGNMLINCDVIFDIRFLLDIESSDHSKTELKNLIVSFI